MTDLGERKGPIHGFGCTVFWFEDCTSASDPELCLLSGLVIQRSLLMSNRVSVALHPGFLRCSRPYSSELLRRWQPASQLGMPCRNPPATLSRRSDQALDPHSTLCRFSRAITGRFIILPFRPHVIPFYKAHLFLLQPAPWDRHPARDTRW